MHAYVVFGLMLGVPLALCLFIALYRDRSFILPATICFIVTLCVLLWLQFFTLALSSDQISYRSFFSGAQQLDLRSIDKIEIQAGSFTYLDRFRPTIRLIIKPYASIGKSSIIVNMKVFDNRKMRHFLDVLEANLKDRGVHVP